jgi:probable phosphoglycerate mutase
MTKIIIVRHGESKTNELGLLVGQGDFPLTDLGLAQAEQTAEALAGEQIDAVYSSDLCRASRTAQPIAEALGLPLELDARLREIDMGLWQGLGFEEAIARFPETERIRKECLGNLRYDGGKAFLDVYARSGAVVKAGSETKTAAGKVLTFALDGAKDFSKVNVEVRDGSRSKIFVKNILPEYK